MINEITGMKKLIVKNQEKQSKEKALVAYGKFVEGKCTKCGKYCHKLTDLKHHKNKEKDEKK